MAEHQSPIFKLVLIGDPKTGKTSYIRRHMTGAFEEGYSSGSGVQIDRLSFYTNLGNITFEIWDVAGAAKFSNSRQYYDNAHCGIVMFDFTSHNTYHTMPSWHRDFTHVCKAPPIVLIGNKSDVIGRPGSVKSKNLRYHRKMAVNYYQVSTKTTHNIEKPFLWLARKLVGNPSLEFVAEPARTPPAWLIDQTSVSEHRLEAEEASGIPLPDEDHGIFE